MDKSSLTVHHPLTIMVTNTTDRDYPSFSLEQVKELARRGAIAYTPTVQRDMANLNYGNGDVCECLLMLQSGHFKNSVWYDNHNSWFDVYHISVKSQEGFIDDLYIKLRLANGCMVVSIISFHRHR